MLARNLPLFGNNFVHCDALKCFLNKPRTSPPIKVYHHNEAGSSKQQQKVSICMPTHKTDQVSKVDGLICVSLCTSWPGHIPLWAIFQLKNGAKRKKFCDFYFVLRAARAHQLPGYVKNRVENDRKKFEIPALLYLFRTRKFSIIWSGGNSKYICYFKFLSFFTLFLYIPWGLPSLNFWLILMIFFKTGWRVLLWKFRALILRAKKRLIYFVDFAPFWLKMAYCAILQNAKKFFLMEFQGSYSIQILHHFKYSTY